MSRAGVGIPAWPALLDVDLASAYVGLGETSFRAWAAEHRVAPVDMRPIRGLRWRRADLDRVIDSLPTRAEAPLAESKGDPAAEALARVQARVSRQSH